MSPNVMFWFVPWAAVTTVVLVLLVWRLVAGDHDTIRIAPENPRVIDEEVQLTRKLARLDFWGKAFTVSSLAFLLMIVGTMLYNTWIAGTPIH